MIETHIGRETWSVRLSHCGLALQDDYSGRQEWTITAAPGGGYSINVRIGRAGCATSNTVLTASACGTNTVSLTGSVSGLGAWDFTAVPAPAIVAQAPYVPILANGQYIMQASGRTTCGTNLGYSDDCGDNSVSLPSGGGQSCLVASKSIKAAIIQKEHTCGCWVSTSATFNS